MNSTSETTGDHHGATHGVCQLLWVRPKTAGTVLSRPIAKSERVTWISVVSSVAMVESTTAITRILPPTPGQMTWPSAPRMLPLFASMVFAGSMTSVAIVKTSKRTKTMMTPMIPPMPAFLWPSLVSSFRFEATSQPQ